MCVDIKDINLYDITIFVKFKDISNVPFWGINYELWLDSNNIVKKSNYHTYIKRAMPKSVKVVNGKKYFKKLLFIL